MARPLFIIVVAAVVAPMTSSAAALILREKQPPQSPCIQGSKNCQPSKWKRWEASTCMGLQKCEVSFSNIQRYFEHGDVKWWRTAEAYCNRF